MHSKRYYTCVTMYILICTEAEPTSAASDTTGIIAGVVAVLILIISGIVIAVVVAVVIM